MVRVIEVEVEEEETVEEDHKQLSIKTTNTIEEIENQERTEEKRDHRLLEEHLGEIDSSLTREKEIIEEEVEEEEQRALRKKEEQLCKELEQESKEQLLISMKPLGNGDTETKRDQFMITILLSPSTPKFHLFHQWRKLKRNQEKKNSKRK